MKEKIAIPVAQGQFAMHFGHCQEFMIVEIEDGKEMSRTSLQPPPHAPGVLPAFLGENGVTSIIAGGMGSRAQGMFAQQGIKVIVGAMGTDPSKVVEEFLAGTLQTGNNVCDH